MFSVSIKHIFLILWHVLNVSLSVRNTSHGDGEDHSQAIYEGQPGWARPCQNLVLDSETKVYKPVDENYDAVHTRASTDYMHIE
jgi:hypothetical protein